MFDIIDQKLVQKSFEKEKSPVQLPSISHVIVAPMLTGMTVQDLAAGAATTALLQKSANGRGLLGQWGELKAACLTLFAASILNPSEGTLG